MTRGDQRIAQITLDEHTVVRRNADVEHERQVAISDLLADNHFAPLSAIRGPFHLHLSVAENRLLLDIRDDKRSAPGADRSAAVALPANWSKTIS